MTIVEESYLVDACGSLTLPADSLAEMGIGPNAPVTVAYLSADGGKNSFSEFLVSGLESTTEQQITIPSELLIAAGIPPDADVEIACASGAIIIYDSPALSVQELGAVLNKLHIAGDVMKELVQDYNDGPLDGS